MRSRAFIIIFLSFFAATLSAKDKRAIDSVENVLKASTGNFAKANALKELSILYADDDTLRSMEYLNKAIALAKQTNDSAAIAVVDYAKGYYLNETGQKDAAIKVLMDVILRLKKYGKQAELARCYTYLGGIYLNAGNYQPAITSLAASTEIAKQLNDEELTCKNLTYEGMCHNQMGDHPQGLICMQEALRIAEKLKDKKSIGRALLFIGSAYSEGPNQDYAMTYFKRCKDVALEIKDTLMLIEVDTYIANNHYYNQRYEKAIELYNQVSQIAKQRNDSRVYAGALGNLGNVYADMGQYEKAMQYQFQAIEIFKKEDDQEGLTICYSAIGTSYYTLKKYSLALEYYQKAIEIATQMHSLEDLIEIHYGFSRTYEALNDYKKAYDNFKMYKQYSDSVFNAGNTKKLTELELNYRFQSQQKEQELVQKNKEILADEKLKRQQQLSYTSIVGVVLLLLLVGFILRSSNQRKRANEQLQQFNNEITLQKEVIEYKNKEITDSINYAKRIQESILPIKNEIRRSFTQSFVLFKPRDVVSGDFYWFAQHGHKNIIACVDCTGHGVPGAFMSMIGNTILNEIVNEKGIRKPSDVLNLLHERVRQSLKQDLEQTETHDGMDIALCSIDLPNGILEFAGANRPLYLVRNNVLEEIKPTKSPIGGDQESERKFINNEIKILKGDCIYMSTDGYADQFGGEKGKKFMVKRFQDLLMQIQDQPMEQQGDTLKTAIEKWQGNAEQVDDILVIGIKI
ncbi:MAG: nprA [Bacteroidetes bacterium]|nr:nprA [Bacteroidota bacterium]